MSSGLKNYFEDNFINGLIFYGLLDTIPHMYSGYIGPQLKKFICESDLIRTVLFFIFLWFSIAHIIQAGDDLSSNTKDSTLLALCLLLFLLFFSKQLLIFNIIQSLLIVVIFILTTLRLKNNFSTETDNSLQVACNYMFMFLIFFLLLGYYFYYLKQKEDKGENFSLKKFILGRRTDKC